MGRRVPGGMVEVGVLVVALAGAAALAGCAASAGGGASQAAARPAAQAAVATASGAAAEVADGSPLAAADRPERLAYAGPGGPAGQSADRLVAQPPGRVVDQVQEALRTAGLRIGQVDERAGLVVATYTGDPSRFVDCGTIIAATDGGDARRLDAAAEGANFRRSSNRRPVLVERGLTLRARLVLQLRPEAGHPADEPGHLRDHQADRVRRGAAPLRDDLLPERRPRRLRQGHDLPAYERARAAGAGTRGGGLTFPAPRGQDRRSGS